MANFEYQTNIHKQSRRRQHAHKLFLILFAVSLLVIGIAAYAIWRTLLVPTNVVTGTAEQSVYKGGSSYTIQTDHFAFTSRFKFEFDQKLSRIPTKYVYHSLQNGQVKHEFTVFRNTVPQDLHVTYILPVSSPDGTSFVPGDLSPKCSVPKGSNLNPQRQVYKDISYICIPDRNEMIVAGGQAGNGYSIVFTDLNEQTQRYGFFYRDLTATPTVETFIELIRSFKLK